MSLHDDLQKKLSTEQMQQLDDLLGDDFDWDLVPRSRLNKVIAQRNELRKKVDPSTLETKVKLKSKSKKDDEDVDDDGDSGVTYSQEELDTLLKAERDRVNTEMNAFKVKQATLLKLQTEKALDPELVFGLLDSTKLSFNDKGELQGLEDAGLKTIKEGKSFLFEKDDAPRGTGKQGSGTNGGSGDALDAALKDVFSGYTFIEESK